MSRTVYIEKFPSDGLWRVRVQLGLTATVFGPYETADAALKRARQMGELNDAEVNDEPMRSGD